MTSPSSGRDGDSGPSREARVRSKGDDQGGGDVTNWESMSIVEVLHKISTMKETSASGDAAAVLIALGIARDVAARMRYAFGTEDELYGLAATGSLTAGQQLSKHITDSADAAQVAATAMQTAVGILTATHGQTPDLERLSTHLVSHPEDSADVRAQVRSIMLGTYSNPMVDVQSTLPQPAPGGTMSTISTFGGTGGSGGGDATNTRSQAGNLADADGPDPAGPGSSPPAAAPAVTPAGARPTTPAGVDAPSGPGGPTSPSRRPASDPGRLSRDGQADPVVPVGGPRSPRAQGAPRPGGPGSSDGGPSAGGPSDVGGPAATGPETLPPAAPWGPVLPGSANAPTTTAPIGGPARGALPAASTPGAPGGAVRPKGDEKHRPARYLNTRENGEELVGGLPLVGPPVIGDWVPQSSPATGTNADAGTAVPAVAADKGAEGAATPDTGTASGKEFGSVPS
ncbi:hypothetical protein ACWDTD_05555 [Gordonia sp. NPDC003425]